MRKVEIHWRKDQTMKTARKSLATGKIPKPERAQPPMPIILRNVPPGFNWGWYSREDQRMHLQVVDRKHYKLGYKIWLERNRQRVFEPAGAIPAKILKALKAEVQTARPTIEAEWVHLMIKQDWLTYTLHGTVMTLIAYPHTPNRFESAIDLSPHLGTKGTAEFKPEDVGLNSEFAVIEIWPQQPETRRPFIRIAPLLWHD